MRAPLGEEMRPPDCIAWSAAVATLGAILAAALIPSCSKSNSSVPAKHNQSQTLAPSHQAARIAARFERFVPTRPTGPRSATFKRDGHSIVLAGGSAVRLRGDYGQMFSGVRASDPMRIVDARSSAEVQVALEHATESTASTDGHVLVYAKGWSRAGVTGNILHRMSAGEIEDELLLEKRPDSPAISYDVSFGSIIRGLRLVENTLEFLDAKGTPRIRMAAPSIVDANGTRRPAHVAVSGCTYDTSPKAPWGRPVVDPGARQCTVRVAWAGGVAYPAVVDPAWSVTGAMVTPRIHHAAVKLDSGRILIVGGYAGSINRCSYNLAAAEIYDPATGTFAATTAMGSSRNYPAAVKLPSGNVLVAGGSGGTMCTQLSTAEIFNPTSATWTPAASMTQAAFAFPLVLLGNGDALAVGGTYNGGTAGDTLYLASADTWVDATGFSARDPVALTRSDGKVVATAGHVFDSASGSDTPNAAIYLFDPATRLWSDTGSQIHFPGSQVVPVRQDSSHVLLLGGGANQDSAEILDLDTFQSTPVTGLPSQRTGFSATLLSTGSVLVAGGGAGVNADLYDPATDTWSTAGSMVVNHSYHTANLLADGKVLLAGGTAWGSQISAELFDPQVANPACGDGVIESPEECDGTTLDGKSCLDFGFLSGPLYCTSSCTFDTSHCSMQVPGDGGLAESGTLCGNNFRDPSEACDGTDLGGHFCSDFGFASGTLACKADCSGFDTSGCVKPPSCGDGTCDSSESCSSCPSDCGSCCGNGTLDPGEACDGTDLAGATCASLGFASGTLACGSTCAAYDMSGCVPYPSCGDGTCDKGETCTSCPADCGACCGNGKVDPGEDCDGTVPAGVTCKSLGKVAGQVTCGSDCKFDESGCCTSVSGWSAPVKLAAEPSIELTDPVTGSGVSLDMSLDYQSVGPSATECKSSTTVAGGADLCLHFGAQEQCLGIETNYDNECTSQPSCAKPPMATCDEATACCTQSVTLRAGVKRGLEFSKDFAVSVLGQPFGASLHASATVGVTGTLKYSRTTGPGCACSTGEREVDAALAATGDIEGTAEMELGAWHPSINVGGKVCVALGMKESATCGPLTASPTGGLKATVDLPEIHFGSLNIAASSITLVDYPAGGTGEACP